MHKFLSQFAMNCLKGKTLSDFTFWENWKKSLRQVKMRFSDFTCIYSVEKYNESYQIRSDENDDKIEIFWVKVS